MKIAAPANPEDRGRGKKHSDLMARKSREMYASVSEIGPILAIVNPKRKKSCQRNLFKFLTTYFPHSTGLSPFSKDHRRVIKKIQDCILNGGRIANVVYREFGKTTVSENAILWAALYGHCLFGLLTGINKTASTANIDSIKSEIAENDLLLEDFPEVCFPVRALEGKPQRCSGQTHDGKRTQITWRSDTITLPIIEGSVASGIVIMARPFAKSRGVKYKRRDGVNARPDLIMVDDPQDDEMAANPNQVTKNLNILKKNLLHTSGHRKSSAVIVNGTVIAKNDMMESLLSNPAWQGERIKFMISPSKVEDNFWLGEYATARRTFDKSIHGDMERAHREATALYLSRRKEADEGCVISWTERYTRPIEESAIQHAYNVIIDDGRDVFQSEYQNEPLDELAAKRRLTAALVASKTNGLPRGTVPKTAEFTSAYIDVHGRVLYYVVSAWANPFQGSVVDYGTFPQQPVAYFNQQNSPVAMENLFPGLAEEARILASLNKLSEKLLGTLYRREDGAEFRVGQLLVDARWGQTNALVKQFCRRHQAGARVMAAQGYGSGTRKPPLRTLPRKPGMRDGVIWRILPPTNGDRWVTIDANACKTLVASRLTLPLGTPGGIELFGVDPREHSMFADHCVSEVPEEITAGGLTYDIWDWPLPHSDNHYWDCLVGSMVGGMMLGCRLEEWGGVKKKMRPEDRPIPTKPI